MALGLFLLLSASVIWSTTPLLAKVAYSHGLSPFWLIEFRLLLGFFFLLLLKRENLSSIKSNLRNLALLALFGLAANYFFYHLGLAYTTASAAQVLESVAPLFVLFLALAMREEVINPKKAAGVFLTALGSGVIFYSHSPSPRLVFGDALELLAALTWGYFIVQGSRVLRSTTARASLTFLFGFSSLLFLLLSVATPLTLTPSALGIALLMGFLHTFLAYLLYFEGIKKTNPTSAGVIFALSPILTVILEVKFLGAMATPLFYLGAAIAITGIVTVITQRKT
jgi:DME family drug/metabolite transporter